MTLFEEIMGQGTAVYYEANGSLIRPVMMGAPKSFSTVLSTVDLSQSRSFMAAGDAVEHTFPSSFPLLRDFEPSILEKSPLFFCLRCYRQEGNFDSSRSSSFRICRRRSSVCRTRHF